MATFVALGAAQVEAESIADVEEVVGYEEIDWRLRYVCSEKEWAAIKAEGRKAWQRGTHWFTLTILGWAMTTGRVGPFEVWHPLLWLDGATGGLVPLVG